MSKSYKNNSRINQKIQTNSHVVLIRRYLTTLLPLLKKHAVKNSQHQENLSTSLKLKNQVVHKSSDFSVMILESMLIQSLTEPRYTDSLITGLILLSFFRIIRFSQPRLSSRMAHLSLSGTKYRLNSN